MGELDERKLRLYQFLYEMKRVELGDIPEPYRSKIKNSA